MVDESVEKLSDRSITTYELFRTIEQNWTLIANLLKGVSSSKASVRYGCAKVLMNLSAAYPTKLYPYLDFFIDLLDSKHRILIWNALTIIANLAKVDEEKRFDTAFDKYSGLLEDDHMVTLANVAGLSGQIALAKPYLADKITNELLKVDSLPLTTHVTEECKRVIDEKAIKSLDLFFDKITQKKNVISFVEKLTNSPRKTLRVTAENFLKKHTLDVKTSDAKTLKKNKKHF